MNPPRSATHVALHRARTAFTLLELLVVISVIAILIAILVPALRRGREQGRIVRCMANQRTLAQGVRLFAEDHLGYGQLMASADDREYPAYRRRERYEFETWPESLTGGSMRASAGDRVPSPWPVAYAPYVGVPGIASEAFFVTRNEFEQDPSSPLRKTPIGVLRCPSDRSLVGNVWWPESVLGAISYNITGDLFVIAKEGWPQTWKNGGFGTSLEGRLDAVIRPAEVLMFVDGGDDRTHGASPRVRAVESWLGPFLSDFAAAYSGSVLLPTRRHSASGGLVGAFVDGRAEFLRPVKWRMVDGQRIPVAHSPNPRITPYEPGATSQ